jgi:hypothetical protein
LGETPAGARLGSGDDGGDMAIGFAGVAIGAAPSFEKGEPNVVVVFSRGVPNTDVLVATGAAGLDGSEVEDPKELRPFGAELNPPGEAPEVIDPKGVGVGDANAANPPDTPTLDSCADSCFEVGTSVKPGPDAVDARDVGVADANAANPPETCGFDSCEPNPDGCVVEGSVKLVAALANEANPPDVGVIVVVGVVPKLVFPNAGCPNAALLALDPNPVCPKEGCPKLGLPNPEEPVCVWETGEANTLSVEEGLLAKAPLVLNPPPKAPKPVAGLINPPPPKDPV